MRLRPRAFTMVFLLGCAHPSGNDAVETVQHVDLAAPVLAGARCQDGQCRCRAKHGDDLETKPPAEGYKRFEIRMKVAGGEITVESPTLGRFRHDGDEEQCVYVDLPSNSSQAFTIDSREAKKGEGLAPALSISEYGKIPKGSFWYGVINIACGLGDRRCDRPAAEAWKEEWLAQRKRGRLDPCGSTVVSALKWDTSGGLHARDGGLLRDFRVQFMLQVKSFDPQLPPNSPLCVPE
jgi:hypothetical protein